MLSRLVEPGQTVAASLQSPTLFTIARDLTQLRLYVDVDEADVGRMQEGQTATFTVDAWAGKTFQSEVVAVHNLPTEGQTVVTYQAVLSVDNGGKLLRPGMTAIATVITSERRGILLVPNAALRFSPSSKNEAQASQGGLLPLPGMGPPPGSRSQAGSALPLAQQGNSGVGNVYTLEGMPPDQSATPHPIQIGGTDGQFTEVLQGLESGTKVITDVEMKGPS